MTRDDLGRTNFGHLGKLCTKIASQIAHRSEVTLASLVEPAHQLTRPERLVAERSDERLELGLLEPEEVGSYCGGFGHGN